MKIIVNLNCFNSISMISKSFFVKKLALSSIKGDLIKVKGNWINNNDDNE